MNGDVSSAYPATYTAPTRTSASVEAVPAPGYEFVNWGGDLMGSTNPTSVLIDCEKVITANFSAQGNSEPANFIDGFVWEDEDGDGIQDAGEIGVSNIRVYLYDANDNLVASTTTFGGMYSFDDLPPGEYFLFFDAPSPYLFSPKNEGPDDEIDSDADPNGRTNVITLTGGDALTLDAGLLRYESGHVDITVQEAKDMIDANPDLIIVDIREESEFCGEGGHIPGAVNYPWNSGVFHERYNELPLDEDILLVCRSAHRTTHAAEFLDSEGYTSVYNMAEGMNAWVWETVGCDTAGGGGGGGGCFVSTGIMDLAP